MTITKEEVRHAAELAHLRVTEVEIEALTRELSAILGWVRKLDELDTSAVPPTAHGVDLPTQLRDDVVAPSLGTERALADAPERVGDGFGVPKIIE